MPIYEFQCKSCDYCFELLLMSKDEMDEVRCPKCASPDVGKLMSAANISTGGASSSGSSASSGGNGSQVVTHSCPSGSCTQFNLPGHTKG